MGHLAAPLKAVTYSAILYKVLCQGNESERENVHFSKKILSFIITLVDQSFLEMVGVSLIARLNQDLHTDTRKSVGASGICR